MGVGPDKEGRRRKAGRPDQRAKRQRRARPRHARPGAGESGKTDEALAEFDKALALDPHHAQALYSRGLIYQREKQHQQAVEDFTAANGLTPQRAEPLLARAISYLAIDKFEGSRRRSRRGGAGRPEKRTGMDDARTGL